MQDHSSFPFGIDQSWRFADEPKRNLLSTKNKQPTCPQLLVFFTILSDEVPTAPTLGFLRSVQCVARVAAPSRRF